MKDFPAVTETMNPFISHFFETHKSARQIYYKKFYTSREIIKESLLPYLPITGFNMPYKEMYDEAKRLIPMMVPHRSTYEENIGWKSLVLHGIASDKTEGAERYGLDPEDQSIYDWTDASKLAPITTNFFKNHFKYEYYHRIRFMLLEPGGYIYPHTDFDHYVLGPINIALNNPDGCDFVMENIGTVPFKPGTIMKLALVNKHAVYNNSSEQRIHMIIHGQPNWDHWDNIIINSYREYIYGQDSSRLLEV